MDTAKEIVVAVLRGVLAINKNQVNLNEINALYRNFEDEDVPLLGHPNLEDLLRSCGQFNVTRIGAQTIVSARESAKDSHMTKMIRETRSSNKKVKRPIKKDSAICPRTISKIINQRPIHAVPPQPTTRIIHQRPIHAVPPQPTTRIIHQRPIHAMPPQPTTKIIHQRPIPATPPQPTTKFFNQRPIHAMPPQPTAGIINQRPIHAMPPQPTTGIINQRPINATPPQPTTKIISQRPIPGTPPQPTTKDSVEISPIRPQEKRQNFGLAQNILKSAGLINGVPKNSPVQQINQTSTRPAIPICPPPAKDRARETPPTDSPVPQRNHSPIRYPTPAKDQPRETPLQYQQSPILLKEEISPISTSTPKSVQSRLKFTPATLEFIPAHVSKDLHKFLLQFSGGILEKYVPEIYKTMNGKEIYHNWKTVIKQDTLKFSVVQSDLATIIYANKL